MRITKYQHACVVLEVEGRKLIVDPGIYTPEFGDLTNVAAIIVTHKHADHFYPGNIKKVLAKNPDVRIFSVEQVKQDFQDAAITVAHGGDEHNVGPFSLSFTGRMHATVHPDWPTTVQNVGVLVNDAFYYAGDSLTLPGKPVKVLAVPVSYAWLKMGEAMDYVTAVRPSRCFLTHNNPLSEFGTRTAAGWIAKVCEKNDIDFTYLAPGEYLDV